MFSSLQLISKYQVWKVGCSDLLCKICARGEEIFQQPTAYISCCITTANNSTLGHTSWNLAPSKSLSDSRMNSFLRQLVANKLFGKPLKTTCNAQGLANGLTLPLCSLTKCEPLDHRIRTLTEIFCEFYVVPRHTSLPAQAYKKPAGPLTLDNAARQLSFWHLELPHNQYRQPTHERLSVEGSPGLGKNGNGG